MEFQYETPLEVTSLFSLISKGLACGNNGVGGHESVDSCRMRESESVGTVELVCIGRLLRMGCVPILMPVCGFVRGEGTMGAE